MCGIAAIFGDTKNIRADLEKSLFKIQHRGNSFNESKIFLRAALGANRLAIVDRAFGRQPASDENNRFYAVQNGEIFNYKKLKKDLIKKGHKLKTDCDTEALVHLWEEYKEKMMSHLDSEMFSFVIYDSLKEEYFVARDPLGVKPLYYAYDQSKRLYLSSEIKQLSQFNFIKEIKEFPAGHYFYKGKFKPYYKVKTSNKHKQKKKVIKDLKKLVEESIKKRVQTDLPIGVFLSGGVDSSLVMELANKYHPDVTALILGTTGSSDYQNALKLCQERKYKYKIITPDINYAKELAKLIYHLESYEPLIIRQSFANHIISKATAELGIKIVLTGEAADELFAGYNEFSLLSEKNINKGCEMLLKSLAKGHHMRVDKMAMRHTIETRSPFFDKALVDYAMQIDGKLKIDKTEHRLTTKAIWRDMAAEYLPDYIAYRYKAPFANGAGMDIGFNYRSSDGILAKLADKKIAKAELQKIKKQYPQYKFSTKEEVLYFRYYQKYKFNKFKEDRYRLVVKDNLMDLEDSSQGQRLLVAEFDKLPMYFPAYLASSLGLYKKQNLDVDFIATGGDDKTYTSLIQNSAQIGMADPMFAMINNPFAVKGEIIGSLINQAPLYVVSFNKQIKIKKLEDLKKYKVGTYEKFSTTNTIATKLLSGQRLKAIHHQDIQQALINEEIEVAIVSTELTCNLEAQGAKIIHSIKDDIPYFLFTGFTIAENLETRYKKYLPKFLQAIKDSVKYINQNPDKAYKLFKKEFNFKQPQKIFNEYVDIWSQNLRIEQSGWDQALHYWRKVYPHLLKDINPFFLAKTKEEVIFELLSSNKYSRSKPYKEFEMIDLIKKKIKANKPIPLVGFWGASDKSKLDNYDQQTIQQLNNLQQAIKSIYKPGLEFNFILSDKHAEINGYSKSNYHKYLSQISKELKKNKFKVVCLSKLWTKYSLSKNKIARELAGKSKIWWSKIKINKQLEKQAAKHASNKVKGAQLYYLIRQQEAEIIAKEFKQTIFWAYSGDDIQEIYPDVPTLYLYSLKKGKSTAPWFIS